MRDMDESGFFDVDFDVDHLFNRSLEFSSSLDFRQVMNEMHRESPSMARSRGMERWSRVKRQTSILDDIVDGEEFVLLPDSNERWSKADLTRSCKEVNRQQSYKRSSTESSLITDSTISRKVSTVFLDEETEKLQKLEEASANGWHTIKRYVDDKKFQHQTSHATTSWAIIRQHLFNMTDADRTRKDLYERYGIIPRLNNDGTYTTCNVMLSPRARTAAAKNASRSASFVTIPSYSL